MVKKSKDNDMPTTLQPVGAPELLAVDVTPPPVSETDTVESEGWDDEAMAEVITEDQAAEAAASEGGPNPPQEPPVTPKNGHSNGHGGNGKKKKQDRRRRINYRLLPMATSGAIFDACRTIKYKPPITDDMERVFRKMLSNKEFVARISPVSDEQSREQGQSGSVEYDRFVATETCLKQAKLDGIDAVADLTDMKAARHHFEVAADRAGFGLRNRQRIARDYGAWESEVARINAARLLVEKRTGITNESAA